MIFFTHIPKTAGTSFFRSVVEPNLSPAAIYQYRGFRRCLVEHGYRYPFVRGHVPYMHILSIKRVRYITFLRDPIDRAISYYYFVKDSDPAIYVHPDRADAESLSLTDFYRLRKYQNWQTRFLAGWTYHRLYPAWRSDGHLERRMLRRAVAHLAERYWCFGLQERFDESLDLFQARMNWCARRTVSREKVTYKRPPVRAVPPATLAALRETNALDCQLYSAATAIFERDYSAVMH